MTEKKYQGAMIVITNKNRDKFYIQQKDETHPIKKFRLCYTFFGGGTEKEENEFNTLERELKEELSYEAYYPILKHKKRIFDAKIKVKDKKILVAMFETALEDKDLLSISKMSVKEGRGYLIKKQDIINLKFMHDINKIVEQYIRNF